MTLITSMANLRRRNKIFLMLLTDAIILPLAFYTAIVLREGTFDIGVEQYLWLMFCIPFIMVPIFVKIGLYRAVIRYMDIKLIVTIAYGASLGTLLITALVALSRLDTLPRTSLGIFWIFSVAYVGASRLLARGVLLNVEARQTTKRRVAIYGAGTAGAQMAYALSRSKDYLPVVFVDDDAESKNTSVIGLRVYSPRKMEHLIRKFSIDEILIAMPSIARSRLKTIIESLEQYELPIKILPAISDVLSGKVRIEQIREIQIEDLLGRDQVAPREELLHKCILQKNVCVTGAGGSIGSELCRQVLALHPHKMVIVDQSEYGLYEIEKELFAMGLRTEIVPVLIDVNDEQKMSQILEKHKVHTVYHAAAYKHVPIVELNPSVGVINNAFGTLALAKASINANVEHFILISTDKAVRPTNVMGASKRLAELILQSLSVNSRTVFSMVRFGNVLGSSGSVVPLFREQIKKGGPITITHKDITRYFMSIPEAAQLVIQAGSMAKGGEVFLLDMGESVKIYDLAKRMIELSGLSLRNQDNPNGDIAIEVTGLRPGEKLYEELLIGGDIFETGHPRILKSNEQSIEWTDLQTYLNELKILCDKDDSLEIKKQLKKIVVEYNPQF